MKVTAIVVAAGSGKRMGQLKQYLDLDGHPLLSYSLKVLQRSPLISSIVVVVPQNEIDRVSEKIVRFYQLSKVLRIVKGGAERQDSVYYGLSEVPSETELVLVHDGARPFLTLKLIEEVVTAAARDGAAILGTPVTDTIKWGTPSTVHSPQNSVTGMSMKSHHVFEEEEKEKEEKEEKEEKGSRRNSGYPQSGCETRNLAWVEKTLPRSSLWAIQTPQAFRRELLERAFKQAYAEGLYVTDEASLLEHIGVSVRLIPGSDENIKITTPKDLALAKVILKSVGIIGDVIGDVGAEGA